VSGRADRWIKRATMGCVAILALIAGTVTYLHMHRPGTSRSRAPGRLKTEVHIWRPTSQS
jgi:hypothetical protein